MWYIYTMEYYTAEKNNNILKFTGKWMELENIILIEVTCGVRLDQQEKCHTWLSFLSFIQDLEQFLSRTMGWEKSAS